MDSSLKNDKEKRGYRKELIYNLDLLKVPYSINYNTNEGKPNHMDLKVIYVSSAYSIFNYGDKGSGIYWCWITKRSTNWYGRDYGKKQELLKNQIVDLKHIF